MFNICLFCKFPFTQLSVLDKRNVEGIERYDLKCSNCGGEFLVKINIERGPTIRNHVINERKIND